MAGLASGGSAKMRNRLTAAVGIAAAVVFLVWFILTGTSFYLYILNSVLLAVIGAAALNLLQGTAGQVSIGNVAFLVVGAFSSVMTMRAGVPYPWDLIVAMVAGVAVGAVVGLPAIRIRGFYLAFATLAAHFILVQLAQTYQSDKVGSGGFIVPLRFVDLSLVGQQRAWAVVLSCVAAVVLVVIGLLTRARLGRTWRVIRDHEIIAGSLGIKVPQYKLGAFMVSSAFIALQGALAAHLSGYVTSDAFPLSLAVSYVAMVLIGGADSLLGSVVGAALVVSLPYLTANVMGRLSVSGQYSAQVAEILYGALVVVFVIYSRGGIAGWLRAGYGWVTGVRRRPLPAPGADA